MASPQEVHGVNVDYIGGPAALADGIDITSVDVLCMSLMKTNILNWTVYGTWSDVITQVTMIGYILLKHYCPHYVILDWK